MQSFITFNEALNVQRHFECSRRKRLFFHGFKQLLYGVGIASIVFLVLSGPAQLERLRFVVKDLVQATNSEGSEWLSPSSFLNYSVDHIIPTLEDNTLLIPTIEVRAPIEWQIPLVESLNGLQKGVVQTSESVLPGEIGRTFIIGHSSGYWWNRNPWTKVFSVLDRLAPSDEVFVRKDEKIYRYRVTGSEVVRPTEVRVVRDETLTQNQLALMTCTPVGTTLNRLIVYASLTDIYLIN